MDKNCSGCRSVQFTFASYKKWSTSFFPQKLEVAYRLLSVR